MGVEGVNWDGNAFRMFFAFIIIFVIFIIFINNAVVDVWVGVDVNCIMDNEDILYTAKKALVVLGESGGDKQ